MRNACRLACCATVLLAVLLVQGCAALWITGGVVAVGGTTGTVAYQRGWYRAVVPYPHFQVDRALRQMCRRARFIERSRSCDGKSSDYSYQDLHDVRVRFRLTSVTPDSTRVHIRVGTWGDKQVSQELYQALEADLQALAH
ncbi:MAG: DUF3568 family protein [Lentisphaeria bacterium]|nr:DUF3568 family protein [Lentisphaeria bacterium]